MRLMKEANELNLIFAIFAAIYRKSGPDEQRERVGHWNLDIGPSFLNILSQQTSEAVLWQSN